MRIFNLTLLVGGVAALFAIAPISSSRTQDMAPTAVHDHGYFGLGNSRHQEVAMRDSQHDQLTDNQTAD